MTVKHLIIIVVMVAIIFVSVYFIGKQQKWWGKKNTGDTAEERPTGGVFGSSTGGGSSAPQVEVLDKNKKFSRADGNQYYKEVAEIQRLIGFPKPDGKFGPKTEYFVYYLTKGASWFGNGKTSASIFDISQALTEVKAADLAKLRSQIPNWKADWKLSFDGDSFTAYERPVQRRFVDYNQLRGNR